jgi:hypothetical protein
VASASPADLAISAGERVGRYFSVVSVLPAFFFVTYVAILLLGTGSAEGFNPGRAFIELGELPWQTILWLVAMSLALGVVVHPLQFTVTQIFEGYWGTSRLALFLAQLRIASYQLRVLDLESCEGESGDHWRQTARQMIESKNAGVSNEARSRSSRRNRAIQSIDLETFLNSSHGQICMPDYLLEQACARERANYPESVRRIMPTRLGNVLRRHEDSTGIQYGLDPITIAPHMALVADPTHEAYVSDQGTQFDLCITICFLGLVATVVSAVVLVTDGFWIALALVPFAIAYLAYVGSISAAQGYSSAVATVIDLDRFKLYESLHLPLPAGTADEPKRGKGVIQLLSGGEMPRLTYKQQPPRP